MISFVDNGVFPWHKYIMFKNSTFQPDNKGLFAKKVVYRVVFGVNGKNNFTDSLVCTRNCCEVVFPAQISPVWLTHLD